MGTSSGEKQFAIVRTVIPGSCVKAGGLTPSVSCPRVGIWCRKGSICGRRFRQFEAAQSTVLSVRSGAQMGNALRQRAPDAVINEIVELRRKGFRFIALADDNFYPVTLTDIALAERQKNPDRVQISKPSGARDLS